MIILAALSLGSQLVLVADGVPTLNIAPSCNAAARAAGIPGRNAETCMASERTARDQLTAQWPQFTQGDKTLCVQLSTAGGSPSYVELISCLEMQRDAREIARKQPNATNGLGGTSR